MITLLPVLLLSVQARAATIEAIPAEPVAALSPVAFPLAPAAASKLDSIFAARPGSDCLKPPTKFSGPDLDGPQAMPATLPKTPKGPAPLAAAKALPKAEPNGAVKAQAFGRFDAFFDGRKAAQRELEPVLAGR